MSKSTPLNQLPNMQQNMDNLQPSNDKESQLVNDILNEIENGENNNSQLDQQQQQQQQQQQMLEAQIQQQMGQQIQQPIETPILNEAVLQAQTQEPQLIAQKQLNLEPPQEKSFVDKITDMVKQPAIVAAICIIMSIPKLNNIIVSILPKKEFILNNSNIFVTIIKGLVAGILFYVLNNTL